MTRPRGLLILGTLVLASLLIGELLSHAQTPPPRGVIRLKVRYKSGDATKELPRKRFFLIKGSLDENKSLVDAIKQTTLGSRECYYRSKGVSERLIKWLDDNDCESVYCREIEERDQLIRELQLQLEQHQQNNASAATKRGERPVNRLPKWLKRG